MDGDLDRVDADHWRLRFVRPLPHPVDEVWRAVTEPDRLRAWFPQRVVGDLLSVGATLSFEEEGAAFAGRVVEVRPPQLLELEWGTDTLRIELVDDGEGGCTLVFTDTITELGKAARDGAGWHTCLEFLGTSLDGAEPAVTSSQRWAAVHPRYVRRFGPSASSIGPPGSEPTG